MRSAGPLGSSGAFLVLLAVQAIAHQRTPVAIRKIPLDSSHKILPEHLAYEDEVFKSSYEPNHLLSPREAILAARHQLTIDEELFEASNDHNATCNRLSRPYRPAFNSHEVRDGTGPRSRNSSKWGLMRRAEEVLGVLQRRQTCPDQMSSCEAIGAPNKCCASNENCVEVEDENVGNVACCPQGTDCDGAVGKCPDGSPACSAELGGGCCIPGFVCQGIGCVPSAAPSPESSTTTSEQDLSTITTTSTTTADGGEPSTVVVTVIVTDTPDPGETTITSTSTTTPEEDDSSTITTSNTGGAAPPWRPTSDDESSATTDNPDSEEPSASEPSGDFCPTGFYACLAREGGGCCRTGRDCATTDCPSTPSTTIVTDGATLVVPVTDAPDQTGASDEGSCADGWFMCGEEAGPVAGCCPDGYQCGTASCTTVSASQTGEVQKQLPDADGLGVGVAVPGLWQVAVTAAVAVGVSGTFAW